MNDTAPLQESALVSFTARNVRCYRDPVTLSMQATRLANKQIVRELRSGAVEPERILPCAAIFGANASGKSAVLGSILDMRELVLNSFREGHGDSSIDRRPFKFDSGLSDSSSFDTELIIDGVLWRYGFEVNDRHVLTEYAYHFPRGRRALVFERDKDNILFGGKFRHFSKSLRPLLRRNSLLLSIIGAVEAPEIRALFEWWRRNGWHFENVAHRRSGQKLTAIMARHEKTRSHVLDLLRAADLGITDLRDIEPDQGEPIPDCDIELIHSGDSQDVAFDLHEESVGTRAWFGLIGPVLDALKLGSLFLLDELDASLHPQLVSKLIEIFQCPATNRKCAQIVFNSHDISILDSHEPLALGRDQVWFSEKGKDGASRLTSLTDYKGRRDEAVGRRYLKGRYGGVPKFVPGEFNRIAGVNKSSRPEEPSLSHSEGS